MTSECIDRNPYCLSCLALLIVAMCAIALAADKLYKGRLTNQEDAAIMQAVDAQIHP